MKRRQDLIPAGLDNNHAGYTLIELVLTLILLGAISTVLLPFFNAITRGADPELRERAVAMGQAMMDEIMAKRWDENSPIGGGPIVTGETPAPTSACVANPCSCTTDRISRMICRDPSYASGSASPNTAFSDGEARKDFDDVDDYHNLIETGSFTDQNSQAFSMPGFTRTVRVCYIPSNSPTIDQNSCPDPPIAPPYTDTKLIIVESTSPQNETFTLVGVSCNF